MRNTDTEDEPRASETAAPDQIVSAQRQVVDARPATCRVPIFGDDQ